MRRETEYIIDLGIEHSLLLRIQSCIDRTNVRDMEDVVNNNVTDIHIHKLNRNNITPRSRSSGRRRDTLYNGCVMNNSEDDHSSFNTVEEKMNDMKGKDLEVRSTTADGDIPTGVYEVRGRTKGSGAQQQRKALIPKAKEDRTVTSMKCFQESVLTS